MSSAVHYPSSGQKYVRFGNLTFKNQTGRSYRADPTAVNLDKFTHEPQRPKSFIKVATLTEDMAASLAAKYDVKNMDRKQYTNLLVELRNAGVLSPQEYSAAYGGTMPAAERGIAWPNGCEEIDFASFLKDCAQLCENVVFASEQPLDDQAHSEALAAAYSHLSELFHVIGSASEETPSQNDTQAVSAAENAAPLTKEQKEVERLTALLKSDKAFSESSYRSYFEHPTAYQLASAMILADEDVLTQIAKELSVTVSQVKSMLNSKDTLTSAQVLFKYDAILVHKARTVGLTDTEKLLSDRLERINTVSQGTFNERMQSIQKEIEEAFQKENMCVDTSKAYSFHLDTSTFTFSVTGGTEEENRMMAEIINKSKNLLETLSALYGHRREDGQYNPWVVEDSPYKNELLEKNDIASVSKEYAEKMKRLFPAWNQQQQNNYLIEHYGFGLDDIEYVGNYKFIGKTDAITELIARMGMDFINYGGGSILSAIHAKLLSRYGFGLHEVLFAEDGTITGRTQAISDRIKKAGDDFLNDIKHPEKVEVPVFEEPMFVFENGQFRVLYE